MRRLSFSPRLPSSLSVSSSIKEINERSFACAGLSILPRLIAAFAEKNGEPLRFGIFGNYAAAASPMSGTRLIDWADDNSDGL